MNKMMKRIIALSLTLVMVLGSSSLIYAAKLSGFVTTNPQNERYFQVKVAKQSGDYVVGITTTNLYSGNKRSCATKPNEFGLYNITKYAFENAWMKIVAQSYDKYGNKNYKKTYYTAKAPKLSATVYSKAYNKARIAWKKTQGADGYYVYQSRDGKTWKKVANTRGTYFITGNLGMNNIYYYAVRSYKTINGTRYTSSTPNGTVFGVYFHS
ncbi:MAG: hypothetical protein HUJ72_05955 [Blautia sp.]|nr:hypothetical protein [Blautia sp.]